MSFTLSPLVTFGKQLDEIRRQADIAKAQAGKSRNRKKTMGMLSTVFKLVKNVVAPATGPLGFLATAATDFFIDSITHKMTEHMAPDPSAIKSESKYGFGVRTAQKLREQVKSGMAESPWSQQGGFGTYLLKETVSKITSEGTDFLKDLLTKSKETKMLEDIGTSGEAKSGKYLAGRQKRILEGVSEVSDASTLNELSTTSDKVSIADVLSRDKAYERGIEELISAQDVASKQNIRNEFSATPWGKEIGKINERLTDSAPAYRLGSGKEETYTFGQMGRGEGLFEEEVGTGFTEDELYQYSKPLPTGTPFIQQLEDYKYPSEFEQGGLVPSQSSTIAEYFDQKGVSLGGSNKQSLAEMMGRK